MSKTAKTDEEMNLLAAEETAEETAAGMDDRVIYLGPSKMGLISATVFIGELPGRAKALIEAVPGANLLFVRIPDAGKAMEDLRDKASALSTIYENARKVKI